MPGSWICFQSASITGLRRSFLMTLPRAQEYLWKSTRPTRAAGFAAATCGAHAAHATACTTPLAAPPPPVPPPASPPLAPPPLSLSLSLRAAPPPFAPDGRRPAARSWLGPAPAAPENTTTSSRAPCQAHDTVTLLPPLTSSSSPMIATPRVARNARAGLPLLATPCACAGDPTRREDKEASKAHASPRPCRFSLGLAASRHIASQLVSTHLHYKNSQALPERSLALERARPHRRAHTHKPRRAASRSTRGSASRRGERRR